MLAGLSVDYYIRLRRGNLSGVSGSVLEALARALQLDAAEQEHLFSLARSAAKGPARRRTPPAAVRPTIQHVLDAISDAPADRKSTRLNSSHVAISYAVFCLKKKNLRVSKMIKQLSA